MARAWPAQAAGQCNHVEQSCTRFQFGVQHDSAADDADRALRGALQCAHGLVQMQQQPQHQPTARKRHPRPAIGLVAGSPLSPKDAQPEVYRWSDASESSVTCEFVNGRLTQWQLVRPAQD